MTARTYATRIPVGRARIWKAGRPALTMLDIELTERCSNDCVHCSVNLPEADPASRREMTAARIGKILEEAAGLGCLSVRFTGGEPLIREDFEDIYLKAKRLGLKVRLFTNATRLTPRLAGLLGRVPPLERVEVSFYGMSRRSYEAVTRRPGSFDAARRGLRLLLENGVPFVLKGALLPTNRDELDEFDSWAAAVDGTGNPPGLAMLFDLRSRRDLGKNPLIRSLRVGPEDYLATCAHRDERHLGELMRFMVRFAGVHGAQLFTCQSGRGRGAVDAYGRYQYCLALRHPETVFELAEGSLREAVTGFLPRLQSMVSTDPAYLERCGRCFLKALCQQCPAKSWAEHGTLDTPVDYLCGVAHAQARAMGLLAEGERAWAVGDWQARVARLSALIEDTLNSPGQGV
jgi:radical SAM protein with 4Fe4S-binding SPASM domain